MYAGAMPLQQAALGPWCVRGKVDLSDFDRIGTLYGAVGVQSPNDRPNPRGSGHRNLRGNRTSLSKDPPESRCDVVSGGNRISTWSAASHLQLRRLCRRSGSCVGLASCTPVRNVMRAQTDTHIFGLEKHLVSSSAPSRPVPNLYPKVGAGHERSGCLTKHIPPQCAPPGAHGQVLRSTHSCSSRTEYRCLGNASASREGNQTATVRRLLLCDRIDCRHPRTL